MSAFEPALFRYYDDIDTAMSMLVLVDECALWRPAVAVVDSIGELLPLIGFRHTFATELANADVSVYTLMKLLGASRWLPPSATSTAPGHTTAMPLPKTRCTA